MDTDKTAASFQSYAEQFARRAITRRLGYWIDTAHLETRLPATPATGLLLHTCSGGNALAVAYAANPASGLRCALVDLLDPAPGDRYGVWVWMVPRYPEDYPVLAYQSLNESRIDPSTGLARR